MSNSNGSDRLDRIEGILEEIAREHKMLLTAQVLLTGQAQNTGEQVQRTSSQIQALTLRVDDLTQKMLSLTLQVYNLTGLIGDHAKDPHAHKEVKA